MSKVSLYKMSHVDVERMTSDSPITVQMQNGKGFLTSEKTGSKTTFPVTADDLADVAVVLNCSSAVKNLAVHLMTYHGHDIERVIEFLNNTAEDCITENMFNIQKKLNNRA